MEHYPTPMQLLPPGGGHDGDAVGEEMGDAVDDEVAEVVEGVGEVYHPVDLRPLSIVNTLNRIIANTLRMSLEPLAARLIGEAQHTVAAHLVRSRPYRSGCRRPSVSIYPVSSSWHCSYLCC